MKIIFNKLIVWTFLNPDSYKNKNKKKERKEGTENIPKMVKKT